MKTRLTTGRKNLLPIKLILKLWNLNTLSERSILLLLMKTSILGGTIQRMGDSNSILIDLDWKIQGKRELAKLSDLISKVE